MNGPALEFQYSQPHRVPARPLHSAILAGKSKMKNGRIFLLAISSILVTACGSRETALNKDPDNYDGYQAVLLDNNQVYFGKLSGLGTPYPVLTDVFYIQARMNPDTKQTANVLLKRGKEWHAPKLMRLNNSHIIMVEPVSKGSDVANLIAQAQQR
jgi:hypothetical protein